jgi:oligopeptide/dipeptide ABC transporter ATP-binding protein
MSAGDAPILEVRGVSRHYGRHRAGRDEGVQALSEVSLDVRPGESLGIIGESGSGKSTLVRMLLALEQPTSGEVHFRGERVSGRPEREISPLRRSVQVVFQDPMSSLDPRMRIRTTISEPLRALRIEGDHRARVRELLAQVGLPEDAGESYPHEFSGGQRQRIAIARALAPNPEVLIADEPVSALDVSVRAQVLNLLRRLIGEFGLTLVFVSHDMSVIRHICTRVAVIYRGRIVEMASTRELYRAPAHPYTRALLASVPRIGEALPPEPPRGEDVERPSDGCAFAPRCPIAIERCWSERPELAHVPGHVSAVAACHVATSAAGPGTSAPGQAGPGPADAASEDGC